MIKHSTTNSLKKTNQVEISQIKSEHNRTERKCKKCGNWVKGHPLPKGQFCQLSPVSFDKLEKQKALHKDKDRVRNATEEARAKARDRNGTFYQILPWGKIAPGFLVKT